MLRQRVETLEEEASSKPVVDVEAFAALEEEVKAATSVRGGLRAQVMAWCVVVFVAIILCGNRCQILRKNRMALSVDDRAHP